MTAARIVDDGGITAEVTTKIVNIDNIEIPDDWREVRPERVDELAESIQEMGLLEPPVVRPLGDDRYELLAGKHRLLALKQLGFVQSPSR